MSMLVFIDNERFPSDSAISQFDEIVVVRNHIDFVKMMDRIKQMQIEEFKSVTFTFDHDLQIFESLQSKDAFVKEYGYKDLEKIEVTGKSMLRCLISFIFDRGGDVEDLPTVEFHTQNPAARDSMKYLWSTLQRHLNNFARIERIERIERNVL